MTSTRYHHPKPDPYPEDEGGPTFYTLSCDAHMRTAKAADAADRAADILSRAAVRGRREGLSSRVIAERLGVSQGTVRRLLAAAAEANR